MAYSEQAVQAALAHTMTPIEAANLPIVEKIELFALVHKEDLEALRACALDRGELRSLPQVSGPLEALDEHQATFGKGDATITIMREAYDVMKRPGRITAYLKGEER